MADYSAGSASVTITPNLDRFAATLRSNLQRIRVEYGVDINPNTTGFAERLRAEIASGGTPTVDVDVRVDSNQARAALAAISAERPQVTVDVDVDAAQARAAITALGTSRPTVTLDVDANTSAATAEIAAISRNRRAVIDVDAATGTAEAEIDAVARNRRTVVDVDTSGALAALNALSNGFTSVMRVGGRIQMVASGIGTIATLAASTIGPLSAMGGLLLSASSTLAALPGIAAGGLAGIAAIGVGVQGVGGAFSALSAAAEDTGSSTSGAMDAAAEAAEAAAEKVENAQRGVENAQRAVENAERGVERAQRGIIDAERGVQDAQRNSERAQKSLNDAREEATRTLEDMNDRLKDSALDEEGAVLAVARAQERLNETRNDSESSELDIQEADLAYRKAVNTLEDMRESNNRLAEDTAEANAAGVEGADNVVAAKERVEDAARGEEQAAQQLVDAQQGLADAQRGVVDAQRNAADAQRDLTKAMEDMAKGADTGSSSVDKAAAAMAKLSPNAREFVNAVRSMGDQWTDLQQTVQDNLFAGMGDSITALGTRQLPVLKTGLSGIASVMNEDVRAAMDVFSTEEAAGKFSVFLDNTKAGFDALGNSSVPLSNIWMNLTTAGSAYFERFGNSVTGVFEGWDEALARNVEDGSFDEMMERSINSAKQLGNVLRDMGGGIANVFRAASESTGGFNNRMEDTMARFHAWTESPVGQNQMAEFFDAANRSGRAVAPLLSQIGGIFTQVMAPNVANFLENAAPGLSQFLDGWRGALEALAPAMPALGAAFGALAGSLGPVLTVMAQIVGPLLIPMARVIEQMAPVLGPLILGLGMFAAVLTRIGPVIAIFNSLFGAARGIITGVTTVWKLLSLAFSASPIGFVITLIAGLVAGLVWFFTQTEVGKKAWSSFMEFLKDVWQGIKDGFSAVWKAVTGFFDNMIEDIAAVPGKIKDFFGSAKDWLVNAGKDMVNGFFNGIGDFAAGIRKWILDKLPGPIRGAVKKVLGFAMGGEVEGLALGGEVSFVPRLAVGGGVPALAGGGQLPTSGPGTHEVDGILGVDGNGIPTARVDAGEYVVNATQTARFRAVLVALNAGDRLAAMSALQSMPGLAGGGTVGFPTLPALAGGGKTPGGMGTFQPPGIDTTSLTTAGNAFGVAAQQMQQTATGTLVPIWQQQGASITAFGQQLTNTAQNVAVPRFQTMANMLRTAKTTVMDPMFGGINSNLTSMGARFTQSATGVVQPVWSTMSRVLSNVKTGTIDPMFAGVETNLTNLGAKFTQSAQSIIQPVWTTMSQVLVNVKTGTIDPMFSALQGGLTTLSGWFGTTVTNINTAWKRLEPGTGKPARFVVETVFNKGIRPAWNNVANLIDGKELKEVNLGTLGQYASGGVTPTSTVPGYSPGYDDHVFSNGSGSNIHLSGGEGIMRPEWVRAVGGKSAVDNMNRAAMNGSLGGFHTGGVVGGGDDYQQAKNRRIREEHQAFAEGGIVSAMENIIGRKYPMLVPVFSGYRPGNDLHGANMAGDFSNGTANTPEMTSLAWDIAKTYPNSKELIYEAPGFNKQIDEGKFVGAGGGSFGFFAGAGNHANHVHWAMDTPPTMPFGGGVFAGGSSMSGGMGAMSMQDMIKTMWKDETGDIPKFKNPVGLFANAANAIRKKMIDDLGKFAEEQAEKMGVGPGSPAGEGAERWRPMVIDAFKFQGEEPTKFRVDGLVGQIGYESNGQEKVLQNGYVDINTGGNEAGGLLQFVPGTFAAYRDPRIPGDRFDGWANINAGVRYYRDHWNYDPWIGRNGPHGWYLGGVLGDQDDDFTSRENYADAPAGPQSYYLGDDKEFRTSAATGGVIVKKDNTDDEDYRNPGKADPIDTGDDSADELNEFRESDKSDPDYYDTDGTGDEEDNYKAPTTWAELAMQAAGYTPTEVPKDAAPDDPELWRATYEGAARTAIVGQFEDVLGLIGLDSALPPALVASDMFQQSVRKRGRMDPAERTIAEREAQAKAVRALPAELQPHARNLIRQGYNLLPNGGDVATPAQIAEYNEKREAARLAAEKEKQDTDATTTAEGDAATAVGDDFMANPAAGVAKINAQQDEEEEAKQKLANGGLVGGKGGPRDDIINIMASAGEFVTNASTMAQAGPLVMAMNANPAAAGALQAALIGTKAAGRAMTGTAAAARTVHTALQNAASGSAVGTGYQPTTGNTDNSSSTTELHYHIETNTEQEGLRLAEQHAKQQLLIMSGA